jgi:hypothetical protein
VWEMFIFRQAGYVCNLANKTFLLNLLRTLPTRMKEQKGYNMRTDNVQDIQYSVCNYWLFKFKMNIITRLAMYCRYNVTWRRLRATNVAVQNNYYYVLWLCVCRLTYPACNAYAPYCHLCPVQLYNIFFQITS